MSRFRICSVKALVWVAVSLALWCGSAAEAWAQSYDFTFSGTSGVNAASVLDGVLVMQPSPFPFPDPPQLAGVSGTLAGTPSSIDGPISFASYGLVDYYRSPTVYNLQFEFTTPNYSGYYTMYLSPGADNSVIYSFGTPFNSYFGTSTVTPADPPVATPAPIPGAGLLSSLVLGFAGLLYRVKRNLGSAKNAVARLSSAASARLFAPNPAFAQPPEAPQALNRLGELFHRGPRAIELLHDERAAAAGVF
jgi:hypothetical protein